MLVDGPDDGRQLFELQQFAIFSVCVAGKNADTVIECVRKFVASGSEVTGEKEPFKIIQSLGTYLPSALQAAGIGCYNQRARTLKELSNSGIDLYNCSVEELEKIWGIGPKTARFFVLFTRQGVDNIAVLDVHILRWLRSKGYRVPSQTPSSTKRYREIEKLFLRHVPPDKTLAQFDYELWQAMSGRKAMDCDEGV
jgi:endonuclease III